MKIRITTLSLLLVLVIGMQMIGYNAIFPLYPIQSDREQVNPTTYAVQTPPNPLWSHSFGSSEGEDKGYDVVECRNGGFALCGYSNSLTAGGDEDGWLIRVDANGYPLWTEYYGGTDDDTFYGIVECSDGGFASVGITYTTTYGLFNMWLVRTDASGNEQWTRSYVHEQSSGWGYSVMQCSDGGFALVGTTGVSGSGDFEAWLLRTDSSGNMLWDQTFGGSSHDYFAEIVESHTGGFALAGYSLVSGHGYDYFLVTTTSSGVLVSSNTYHNIGHDYCHSLVRAGSAGGYALCGRTGTTDYDFWLVRTDASGNKLWDKTYGDNDDEDTGYGVAECWDGGFVLSGYTDRSITSYDLLLIRTDSSGNTLWEQAYGGSANYYNRDVIVCSDGNYVLVGYSYSTGDARIWLMCIPSIINPGFPLDPTLMIVGGVIIVVVVVVVLGFVFWRRRRTPAESGV